MRFAVRAERWPLRRPFVIARETMVDLPLVHLHIEAEGATGRAEAAGVDYCGETADGMAAAIEHYLGRLDAPPTRERLLADLPEGGVRNAIDCALWDWEAKRRGRSAAELAGFAPLRPLTTAYTLGLDAPAAMADALAHAPSGAPLKLKLGGRDGLDVHRVTAVRKAAPTTRLVVDVNEGWSFDELDAYAPELADLGVELIEQPLPARRDAALADYAGPVPLCADESFNGPADFDRLGGYAFVNVKLDKCGGLTAALAIVAEARRRELGLFVGSMLGTSLGMAPAFLVGQSCDFVDLDGPLLLAADRSVPLAFEGATIRPPTPALWG